MMNAMRGRWAMAVVLGSVVGIAGCASQPRADVPRADVNRAAAYLAGSFSSAEQAAADAEFFDIRLHIVPIWPERTDGVWMYVEQARADVMDRPYRQRVYRLVGQADGTVRSDVFEMPEPLRFAGAWQDATKLAGLRAEELTLKEGCAVVLRWVPDSGQDRRGPAGYPAGAFVGGTVGTGCASTLRGATHATSEVELRPEGMVTWDRGFDASGEQVWGAKKGGYVFVKQGVGGGGGK